jgi:hypothetical protein
MGSRIYLNAFGFYFALYKFDPTDLGVLNSMGATRRSGSSIYDVRSVSYSTSVIGLLITDLNQFDYYYSLY